MSLRAKLFYKKSHQKETKLLKVKESEFLPKECVRERAPLVHVRDRGRERGPLRDQYYKTNFAVYSFGRKIKTIF